MELLVTLGSARFLLPSQPPTAATPTQAWVSLALLSGAAPWRKLGVHLCVLSSLQGHLIKVSSLGHN